jgi:hypothetical protein
LGAALCTVVLFGVGMLKLRGFSLSLAGVRNNVYLCIRFYVMQCLNYKKPGALLGVLGFFVIL